MVLDDTKPPSGIAGGTETGLFDASNEEMYSSGILTMVFAASKTSWVG
jgi:hypothetical protein